MSKESLYWYIVLITFFYIIFKNRNSSLKILLILCFYSGLAASFGKTIENPYKILLVLLSVYLLVKNNGLSGLNKRENILLFVFILFSLSFLFSVTVNGGYFNLVFSQYGKYVTPICAYFIFRRILIKNPALFINLNELFFSLLTIQILLSVVKILTLGLQESVVGSLSNIGGGLATPLPVFGFILVWMHKQGVFTKKDWFYVFLLLLIGFASYKRAIWFIMPATILMFMYFVPKKISFKRLLYYIPLVPIIFYAGIRLNPTLNKEGKIGGSFDLKYTLDYVQSYSFGKNSETSEVQSGQGRGGAIVLLWNKLFSGNPLSFNDYWGFGLEKIYTIDYEEFDESNFGLTNKGAASGIFQSYIVGGFIGILLSILLLTSVLRLIKEPRIRIAMAVLLFWDYFFYSGLILRTQALFILFFFIIIYSNHQFDQKLYRKYSSLMLDGKKINLQSQTILK
jgi:hypothetical protein